MSIPDKMLKCLHAAGIDPNSLSVTWNICMNADGTISGHVRYDPNVVDSPEDKWSGPTGKRQYSHIDKHSYSAGKRQYSEVVAGHPQLPNAPVPFGSAGNRQLSALTAGKSKLFNIPSEMAGAAQRSRHSKKRTPSQCRRSARRRSSWRELRCQDTSDIPQHSDVTTVNIDSCTPAADVPQLQSSLESVVEEVSHFHHSDSAPAADVPQPQLSPESVVDEVPHLCDCDSADDFWKWKAWVSSQMASHPLLSLLLSDSWALPELDKVARDVALDELETMCQLRPGYLVRHSSIKSARSLWFRIASYFNIVLD